MGLKKSAVFVFSSWILMAAQPNSYLGDLLFFVGVKTRVQFLFALVLVDDV